MREQEERGKPVELRVYSPQEAIEEIYQRVVEDGITSRKDIDPNWHSFSGVVCTIAHGNVDDGHIATLDFQGFIRPSAFGTEIFALGKIDDPQHLSIKGNTLVIAKVREEPPPGQEKEFLKRIIGWVAHDYQDTPGLFDGPQITLGGLDFGYGGFGRNKEISGVFVSVNRWLGPALMDPTQRAGNSIEITQTLVDKLVEEIKRIRLSAKF